MRTKQYYELLGKLISRKILPCELDNDSNEATVDALLKIRRLARKHDRLAEMDCNGEGYVKGQFYRCDGSTPGAYVDEDTTIFTAESAKVQDKIKAIATPAGIAIEFQGDPRGYTVKLAIGDKDITHLVLA